MEQVLVRLSGQTNLEANPVLQRAIKQAAPYLSEFSYGTEIASDLLAPQVTEDAPAVLAEQKVIKLRYQPQLVLQLLKQAEFPIWPTRRPQPVLWIIVDGPEGRQLVSGEFGADIRQVVEREMRRRGLQPIWPNWDLEEQLALSKQMLWQQHGDNLRRASSRYGSETYLAARVYQTSTGRWMVNWLFAHQDQLKEKGVRSYKLDRWIADGIDLAANTLVERYAVVSQPGAQQGLNVRISGVAGYPDYQQIKQYLQGLVMVSEVTVRAAKGNDLYLELASNAELMQLLQRLALDNWLVPVEVADADATFDLALRWQK
jgi:hypothetical protein